jgi:hypothetical protein
VTFGNVAAAERERFGTCGFLKFLSKLREPERDTPRRQWSKLT